MMDIPQGARLPRPAPTPPVAARPRRLSVTEIETWLRDPYAIYAKHVLRLRQLDALDEAVGPLERGTTLHKALELFIAQYPGALPDDAVFRLATIADQVFAQAGIPKAALALWRPRFLSAARGFIEFERGRRSDIINSHLEVAGRMILTPPGGDFELRGVADRIDILQNGKAAILDYKTGALPSIKQVEQLLSPQLPLEAAILLQDGFPGIGPRVTEALIYLSLASEKNAREPRQIENSAALTAEATRKLAERILNFDNAATPYRPRVRPFRTDIAGDYDHLARVREWSPSGWVEED